VIEKHNFISKKMAAFSFQFSGNMISLLLMKRFVFIRQLFHPASLIAEKIMNDDFPEKVAAVLSR